MKPTPVMDIAIRTAQPEDTDEIYDILLASEGYFMNMEQIKKKLSDLIVLIHQKRLIAILSYHVCTNHAEIQWVAIHPGYPESSISLALRYLISGISSRQHSL